MRPAADRWRAFLRNKDLPAARCATAEGLGKAESRLAETGLVGRVESLKGEEKLRHAR